MNKSLRDELARSLTQVIADLESAPDRAEAIIRDFTYERRLVEATLFKSVIEYAADDLRRILRRIEVAASVASETAVR